jgi:hypothetical protein
MLIFILYETSSTVLTLLCFNCTICYCGNSNYEDEISRRYSTYGRANKYVHFSQKAEEKRPFDKFMYSWVYGMRHNTKEIMVAWTALII